MTRRLLLPVIVLPIAFLMLGGIAPGVTTGEVPITLRRCEEEGTLKITSFRASPNPPRMGTLFEGEIFGSLTQTITSGRLRVESIYDGQLVYDEEGPIDLFLNIRLPLVNGPVYLRYNTVVERAPAGPYVIRIRAVDQEQRLITCVEFHFESER